MNLTDELQKLAELHASGQLSDQEFNEAKRRLIGGEPAPATRPHPRGSEAIPERTYQSSRWSSGNFLFPDRLTLSGDGMLFQKRRMFGSKAEHINYHAVASFRITNGVFLSTISIETSGSSQPIVMNGIWKSQARQIQDVIREYQSGT